MDRRDFLRGAVAVGALALTTGAVAACGDDSTTQKSTIRIAALGSTSDTLDMLTSTSPSVYVAAYNIWDSLALLVGDKVENQLAQEIEHNADATEWTIRLRDAKFSNGKAITADDVLASVQALAKSTNLSQFWGDVDLAKSHATDQRTVVLQLNRPRADFVEATLAMASLVLPGGKSDPRVGSGAYQLDSGTAATGFILVPNPHYYGDAPAVTRVEVRTVVDTAARARALTSGQIDIAADISPTAAQTMAGNSATEVIRLGGGSANAMTLVLNTRTAPFSDPDVRRALRATLDREQLVKVVFDGRGTVGNDLIGLGLPGYDTAIPAVTRDLALAKRIFAAKGISDLTLTTSEIVPGMNNAAELIKQQLTDVGVTLTVKQVDPTTFFADMSSLARTPFFTSYYINRPVAGSLPFMVGANSPYNMSGFTSATVDSALQAAQRETDPAKRQDAYNTVQRELHDNGGELIWGYRDSLIGVAKGISIPRASQGLPLLNSVTFH